MSDTPGTDRSNPIPLAHEGPGASPPGASAPPSAPVPVARPASKPLLDLADDSCPHCGAPMAPDAVVCMRCGYDQKAGAIRKPQVGVEFVESSGVEPKSPHAELAEPEFVTPGRLSARHLAAAGVCITILAMIGAGIATRALGWPVVAANVALTFYNTLLHAATGLAAVAIAARLAEERFTRADLAAARMFVAFALFQGIVSLVIPGVHPFISKTAVSLVGAGAYFLALMVLFKKDHTKAGMIALIHAALWGAVSIAAWLSVWLRAATAAAPAGVAQP